MKKLALLLLLVFALSVVEIQLFAAVTNAFGALATVLLIIATAVVGVAMLRKQGMAAFKRMRAAMAGIAQPPPDLLESAFLLMGGVLMISPGFFSDFVGGLCLLPPARRLLIRYLAPKLPRWAQRMHKQRPPREPREPHELHEPQIPRRPDGSKPDIIEGKYRRRD